MTDTSIPCAERIIEDYPYYGACSFPSTRFFGGHGMPRAYCEAHASYYLSIYHGLQVDVEISRDQYIVAIVLKT